MKDRHKLYGKPNRATLIRRLEKSTNQGHGMMMPDLDALEAADRIEQLEARVRYLEDFIRRASGAAP